MVDYRICENGHAFGDMVEFDICPYCDTELSEPRERTKEDRKKNMAWFSAIEKIRAEAKKEKKQIL